MTDTTSSFSYPMRCKWCHAVHDAAKVEVLQRYADCSVWKCPSCGIVGDDRPIAWGGSFERVTKEAPPKRVFARGEFGGES